MARAGRLKEGRRIVLIACASKKIGERARAQDLYISELFRASLGYARSIVPDATYILSAKHHLLPLTQQIDPYNLTLNEMPLPKVEEWAERVLEQLEECSDLKRDCYLILAGDRYRRFLVPRMKHVQIPMIGLTIGKQLQYLKARAKRVEALL